MSHTSLWRVPNNGMPLIFVPRDGSEIYFCENNRGNFPDVHAVAARPWTELAIKKDSDMKALTWHGKGDIRCEQVDDPTIEDDRDIIIRVTSCAICGSDLHLMNGYMPTME